MCDRANWPRIAAVASVATEPALSILVGDTAILVGKENQGTRNAVNALPSFQPAARVARRRMVLRARRAPRRTSEPSSFAPSCLPRLLSRSASSTHQRRARRRYLRNPAQKVPAETFVLRLENPLLRFLGVTSWQAANKVSARHTLSFTHSCCLRASFTSTWSSNVEHLSYEHFGNLASRLECSVSFLKQHYR